MERKKSGPRMLGRYGVFLTLSSSFVLASAARAGTVDPALMSFGSSSVGAGAESIGSGDVFPLNEASSAVPDGIVPRQEAWSGQNQININLIEPGLTGENWFSGLGQGAGNPSEFVASKGVQITAAPGVNATAIPSLPSLWSGLSCCGALVFAGMFPRVRRVFK